MNNNDNFNVRSINLTKISRAIDLEIVIDECDYALEQITNQRNTPGFGNSDWLESTQLAEREIRHRRRLAKKKLDHITTTSASFADRFLKAARATLPPETYKQIHSQAEVP